MEDLTQKRWEVEAEAGEKGLPLVLFAALAMRLCSSLRQNSEHARRSRLMEGLFVVCSIATLIRAVLISLL